MELRRRTVHKEFLGELWFDGICFELIRADGRRHYRDPRGRIKIFHPVPDGPRFRVWLLSGPSFIKTYPRGLTGRNQALRFAAFWLRRHPE